MDDLVFDPDEIEAAVVEALPGTAMFASIFREASARALLLPRQRPGKRTPLWQQRQRGADLLAEAAKHPTFPMLLETTRECLRDIFDVPALREVMADLRSRTTRMVAVDTERRVAVRAVAAVPMDRGLDVRRRRSARRTPGRRARRSTGICCVSSWAPRSCATCWTLAPSTTPSSNCSGSPTDGGLAERTACTTCCATLGDLTDDEVAAQDRRRCRAPGSSRSSTTAARSG